MLSWLALTGEGADEPLARMLYGALIVFVALVLGQYPKLRAVPFAVSSWAYTFPAAAAAAAATMTAGALDPRAYDVVAIALLGLASLVVGGVLLLTLRAALRRQICLPD